MRASTCLSNQRRYAEVDSDDEESMEASDKDHWGFDTREVQADWTETSSPPLEMFHWRRVVVDEFTYLKPSDRCVVLGLKSESRWCLSGTPPVGRDGHTHLVHSLVYSFAHFAHFTHLTHHVDVKSHLISTVFH